MKTGFLGLLALVFIVLKLIGSITWSWWYVLMPLWLGTAILLGVLVISFIVIFIKK